MDFLNDKIKPLYFKYLFAAFGSALITSIYSVVDAAMVGKYQGPVGTAALAVVAPIWNIIYSFGLLTGIGGSVLFSIARGKNEERANEFFTVSLLLTIIISFLLWLIIIFFDRELLVFFGADDTLLPLARKYLLPIKFVVPSFLFTQFISSFLRNDNDPNLATKAVIFGGVFNIFGDYFFVFTLDMGIMGAGLATAIGSVFSLIIMLTHFFKKQNTLALLKPKKPLKKSLDIFITGFSTFFIDIAMGILTIMFNRQILKYLDSDALAVYGVIINVSTFVQCCAYSIGQASQPLISQNFGALKQKRVAQILKYALLTAFIFGMAWTSLTMLIPNGLIYLFMKPTANILKIAPKIMRIYGLSFLLLPLNIFSTYYFQAIMKPKISFIISVFRGIIISGILVFLLPLLFSNAIWFTMPITELLISIFVIFMMVKFQKCILKRRCND